MISVGDWGREIIKTKCLRVVVGAVFYKSLLLKEIRDFSTPSGLQTLGDYH